MSEFPRFAQRLIARVLHTFVKPWVEWYLRRDRFYSNHGIRLLVKKGVFHPGFFGSTKFLLSALEPLQLVGTTVLEIGAGSGLISFYAAKRGSDVTAIEVDPVAIGGLEYNNANASVKIKIIHSDLFANLPAQPFDLIMLNPPFYAAAANTNSDLAWNAGTDLEYFERLFAGLHHYVHAQSKVLMVFPEIPELARVQGIAGRHGWKWEKLKEKNMWYEKLVLFRITPQPKSA